MKAVFWDLDDTLLNTLLGRMEALAHAYQHCLGETTDPHALWREHNGRTLEDLGRRLAGDDWRRFAEAYRDHYYALDVEIAPFAGVRETLDAFAEHGLHQAVVTSKVSWGATEELTRTGLLERFAAVVGFDDSDVHKPEPEPLFIAMERLLIDEPGAVAYVGDTPADIEAARAAGCHAIGAAWGSLDPERLQAAGPDLLATEPGAVLRYVERIATGART